MKKNKIVNQLVNLTCLFNLVFITICFGCNQNPALKYQAGKATGITIVNALIDTAGKINPVRLSHTASCCKGVPSRMKVLKANARIVFP